MPYRPNPLAAKQCVECLQDLPLSDFMVHNRTLDGFRHRCNNCSLAPGLKTKETLAEDYYFRYHIRKKYGLSREDWDEILISQNGRCAICARPAPESGRRFHVDHDHECCPGKTSCGECVRGLLCFKCNALIGNAEDNIDILQAAIAYLEL